MSSAQLGFASDFAGKSFYASAKPGKPGPKDETENKKVDDRKSAATADTPSEAENPATERGLSGIKWGEDSVAVNDKKFASPQFEIEAPTLFDNLAGFFSTLSGAVFYGELSGEAVVAAREYLDSLPAEKQAVLKTYAEKLAGRDNAADAVIAGINANRLDAAVFSVSRGITETERQAAVTVARAEQLNKIDQAAGNIFDTIANIMVV